jgi:hypothetical protein
MVKWAVCHYPDSAFASSASFARQITGTANIATGIHIDFEGFKG